MGVIPSQKFFSKSLKKVLTNRLTYAILIPSREGRTQEMLNWYENPELHAEDYEELMELLKECAEDAEG